MKSKLSMKILGVVVAFATIASLLVGITAAPVSAAAPGALAWTVTASPSAVGSFLTAGITISKVVAAADGLTVFAWDNTAKLLYKSTNGGASWGSTPTSVPITGSIVAMVISPKFATDGAIAIASTTEVYLSTNGGSTFNNYVLDLATQIDGGTITSMDVGYFYSTPTALSVLIGITGGAGTKSNVLMYTSGAISWAEVGNITTAGIGNYNVLAVMFSPSIANDAEIMCVYTGGGKTWLASHYGAASLAWNAYIPARDIVATAATTNASIAVGSDYVGNTGMAILVSLYGTGLANGNDNMWKITGRQAVAGSAANLLVIGAGLDVSVQQMSVSGTTAAGTVFWTVVGANTVKRATGGTAGFTVAGPSKNTYANGATQQAFVWVGGANVFACVAGPGGGVFVSTDAGVSFNGVGLHDVGTVATTVYSNLVVVDANTMFVIMTDAAYTDSLIFKTTDAGATWKLIRTTASGTYASTILVSPAYATDSTIVVLEPLGIPVAEKSTNGGATFTGYGVPTNAAIGVMVDANNFFAASSAGSPSSLYKNTRFTAATFPSGFTANFTSIALNPKDATNATTAVGCDNAAVYVSTNDGVSYTKVSGATTSPAGNNAMVTYGPDGTLYAATTTGLWGWNGTDWVPLSSLALNDVVVSADNTLYASVPAASGAVIRSLKPTATSASKAEVCQLNSTAGITTVAFTSQDVDIVSGAAANSLYVLDTAVTQTGYTVPGGIYGFSDTMIAAPTITAPINGTFYTSANTTFATLSWPAVTGATDYRVTLDGTESAAQGNVTSLAIGSGAGPFPNALAAGSAHTWSVRVDSIGVTVPNTYYGRPSATATFTMGLPTPGVTTVQNPTQGATNVPVDTTFTWPAVAGATYQFVIAEELGNVDKFAIIDYSATCPTNATVLRETLKYDTTYWWRVRAVTATTQSDWTTAFFTTEPEPVATSTTTTNPPVTTIIVPTQPVATPTVTIINSGTPAPTTPVIPTYLLWAVIAVGAVLVIAVIVLIVRTRRIP